MFPFVSHRMFRSFRAVASTSMARSTLYNAIVSIEPTLPVLLITVAVYVYVFLYTDIFLDIPVRYFRIVSHASRPDWFTSHLSTSARTPRHIYLYYTKMNISYINNHLKPCLFEAKGILTPEATEANRIYPENQHLQRSQTSTTIVSHVYGRSFPSYSYSSIGISMLNLQRP